MKKASRRLPPHPRRRQSGRYSAESSERLGRQLSVSVILCAFFMIISFVGGSSSESLRARASELIGRNVLEDFTPQEGLRANIDEFVRCMYVRNRSRFYGVNRLTLIGGYIYAVVVFVHVQNRIDTASAKRCYDPVIHRVDP